MNLDAAYAECRAIAHKHGANFSVGFRFLPKAKRRAVYAAYAFCRVADDIADEPGVDKSQRLDQWQAELDRAYANNPTHPITIALADALTRFDIPKSAFVALIDGCRQDMVKTRYETFEELLHYCELVASSISDISLPIFGYRTPKAIDHGRSLATALQLTNVTRDIGDDLTRDRIYVPALSCASSASKSMSCSRAPKTIAYGASSNSRSPAPSGTSVKPNRSSASWPSTRVSPRCSWAASTPPCSRN